MDRARYPAFTLIELLVVIAVIALLVGILLPVIGQARATAKGSACMANLRGIGQATVLYADDNKEGVIPSYNMTGVSGAGVPLDGWGPILDRDGYMNGFQGNRDTAFVCPAVKDVAGVAGGQTGSDPDNTQGWMDWPNIRTGSANVATTIPDLGFDHIVRVAYWINAFNPIGSATTVENDTFYTGSVGYGPGTNGQYVKQTRLSAFVRPHTLITVADGIYAGRQRDNRIGATNSRIGYRHPGGEGVANAAFADGHVIPIRGRVFPRSLGGKNDPSEVRDENSFGLPTVYANPDRIFGP